MAAVLHAGPATRISSREARSTVWIAIAASVAIHGLVLFIAPGFRDKARTAPAEAPPLVAHLVPVRPAPSPPPAIEPAPRVEAQPRPKPVPTPAPKPPAPQPQTVAPSVVSQIVVPPVPPSPPAPPAEAPRTVEPVQAASPPTSPVAAPKAVTVAPAPPASASKPAVDATEAATLGQYRIAIITAARRYKRYPRIAIDNNWEGTAEVRMVIDASGAIASISVKTRSGYETLDQQALEMIRKAKPLTPIPASLRGKGFSIEIPVVFSLKDDAG